MLHRAKPQVTSAEDSMPEMGKLTATVAKWGQETGFLGIEHPLELRLVSMVREAAARLFGSFETDLGRLRSELDAIESEWDQAVHRVAGYRSRFGELKAKHGWWTALRVWLWDFREYRTARSFCRRREPDLRSSRLEFAVADRKAREAREWSEIATQALQAHYEYEKARAACLRPEKS